MRKIVILSGVAALALSAAPVQASCVNLPNYSSCIDAQGNQTVVNRVGGYPQGMTMVTSNNKQMSPTSSTTLAFGQVPVIYGTGYGNGAWSQPQLTAGATGTVTCAGGVCQRQ